MELPKTISTTQFMKAKNSNEVFSSLKRENLSENNSDDDESISFEDMCSGLKINKTSREKNNDLAQIIKNCRTVKTWRDPSDKIIGHKDLLDEIKRGFANKDLPANFRCRAVLLAGYKYLYSFPKCYEKFLIANTL